jgi:hypothetical protein
VKVVKGLALALAAEVMPDNDETARAKIVISASLFDLIT